MKKNIETSRLCFIGDIHGNFAELVYRIYRQGFKDTSFILLGDCGLGFQKPRWINDLYKRKLKKRLVGTGNKLYLFRGNHDDPDYYPCDLEIPEIETLADYTHLSWEDRNIVVIGGGVSVDKEYRLEYEAKKKKKIWFPGERIEQDLSKLSGREDIIASHMAPLCFGPVLNRCNGESFESYTDTRHDREYLSTVFRETSPKRWYFGHYHTSLSGCMNGCLWKGLDIMEFSELDKNIVE